MLNADNLRSIVSDKRLGRGAFAPRCRSDI